MKVIGLAGWSGAGKTTLLTRAIPQFAKQGLRVSVIKHAHHAFDVDVPGKDSWRHREAGAAEVLVSSSQRWALMHELRGASEPRLSELLAKMTPVDLVVVEGFKTALHAKIEVYRREVGKPPFHPENPSVAGIASDTPFPRAGRPVVDLADVDAVVDLMVACAEPIDVVLARAGLAASRERSLPAVT
jgi:molybdopterin-guanine dinucleotide biosynthesis protein B